MSRFEFDPYPSISPQSIPLRSENIPTDPAMFGGLIASAEQKLGQGIESVAEKGLDVLQARQQLNNEVHANDRLTDFAAKGTAEWEKFRTLEGQAAVNALPNFHKRIDELRQETLEGENLAVRAHLSRGLSSLTDRYYGWAAGHAGSEERKWHDKSAIDGAKTFGNQAAISAQAGTWTQVDQDLHASDERIATYWRQKNPSLDPDSKAVIDHEVRRNRGANVRHIVDTLSNLGQAREAQAVFDRYKNTMDLESIDAVTSRLKSDQSRLRGWQYTDELTGTAHGLSPGITAVRNDAFSALEKKGIQLDVTSGYRSPEHNAAVGGARGSQHLRGGAIDVSLKGLTPDQQQAVVDQFLSDRRVGGFGYYPRSDSIHVDLRHGTRTAWGSDYHGTSVGEGWPSWLTDKVQTWQGSAAPRASAPAAGGPVDQATVYNRITEHFADDPLAQTHAIARAREYFAFQRNERTQGLALFNRRVDDTRAEALVTGGVRQPLTEDDFLQHRKPSQGEDEARENYQSYLADLRNGADRHAMEDMSSSDMRAMVAAAEPRPDSPGGMTRATQRQAFLQKSMEEIEKKRRDDPASAVAKSPAVTEALKRYDPQTPETFRSVANARLAAQAELGIDPGDRTPITKDEALQMTAPLWRALPGQERDAVVAAVGRFEKMFGPDWPQAFTYALGTHREDQATKEAAAALIRRFVKGQPVGPTEAREADQRSEVHAAEGAANATAPARRQTNPGRVMAREMAAQPMPQEQTAPKELPPPPPPERAVTFLRHHPETADKFDVEYGKGMAAQILKSYPKTGQ